MIRRSMIAVYNDAVKVRYSAMGCNPDSQPAVCKVNAADVGFCGHDAACPQGRLLVCP